MSCDPDAANNFLSPFNHGHSPQNLALIGLVVSEKNIFENGRRRQRPRTDGRYWIIAHTVQSRVFSPTRSTPWRIVLSPLQSHSVVHRGPTADPPRTVAVPRRYIELPVLVNGKAIEFYLSLPTADLRGSANLGVLATGCRFLILFIVSPSPRGRGGLLKNLDCTVLLVTI